MPILINNSFANRFCLVLGLFLLLLLSSGCDYLANSEATPTMAQAIVLPTITITVPPPENATTLSNNNRPEADPPPAETAESLPIENQSTSVPARPLFFHQLWRFSADDKVTDLDMISLDGGPVLDIVAASYDGRIYALGANQDEYWRVPLPGPVFALTTADMDQDTIGDVIAGGLDNQVSVIEGGLFRWRQPLPGHMTDLIIIEGSEAKDDTIVVATGNGWLTAFDTEGNEKWSQQIEESGGILQLGESDLSGDGAPDIISALESGRLIATSVEGQILWQKDYSGPVSFAVADIDNNGQDEVIVGTSEGELLMIEGSGEERQLWQAGGRIRSLAVTNIRGDGPLEILVSASESPSVLTLLDGITAQVYWQTNSTGVITALSTGDPDGDGQVEIIAGSADGQLITLDSSANIRGDFILDEPVSGLVLNDLDPNKPGQVLIVWAGSTIYLFEFVEEEVITTIAEEDSLPVQEEPVSPSTEAPIPIIPPLPEQTPIVDLSPQYSLAVNIDYSNHFVQTKERITLANNSHDSWLEVPLHISTAYWPGIFEFGEVQVTLDGVTLNVTPTLQSNRLTISLPRPAQPAESVIIDIDYSLSIPRLDPLGWGPTGNTGWGPRVLQMGDWYPTIVPYQDGEGWYTWEYHPVGDPVISLLADYDVTIEAPADLTVAAAGWVGEDGTTRRYKLENARSFSFLASYDFARFAGVAGGVPIQVFVSSAHQDSGPVVVEATRQSIELFSRLFGPYPYHEFVMAENGFLTAMEYSAMVSLSSYAFDAYEGTPDSLLVAITAHEVAHQWWYGAVGNNQIFEPWLDESLSMMSEILFYETYYPEYNDWWWQYRVDRWNPVGPVDVSIYEFQDSPTFVHNMYSMSARFLRELRFVMGAGAFQTFLQAYYSQYTNQFATGQDFFETALHYTDADLVTLMETYFRKPPLVRESTAPPVE